MTIFAEKLETDYMKGFKLICVTVLLAGCTAASTDVEQQVDELYGKMSQEERIAQLRSMYMDDLFDEQESSTRPNAGS